MRKENKCVGNEKFPSSSFNYDTEQIKNLKMIIITIRYVIKDNGSRVGKNYNAPQHCLKFLLTESVCVQLNLKTYITMSPSGAKIMSESRPQYLIRKVEKFDQIAAFSTSAAVSSYLFDCRNQSRNKDLQNKDCLVKRTNCSVINGWKICILVTNKIQHRRVH